MQNIQFLTTAFQKYTIGFLLLLLPFSLCAKEKIVLGLTGTVFKDDLKNFMDWEKYLEHKIGDFDVQIHFTKTYSGMNQLIKEQKVDIAYVCNSSYTKLDKEGTGKLLAIPIFDGSDTYYSYIITKKENPYTSILDFKGKLFAFTDPQSNSGAIAPSYYLLTQGLSPKTFFKSFIYTYEHGESIKAVIDGFVDGASVDSIVYTRFAQKHPKSIEQLKVIQILGPYTNSPIVARTALPQKDFLKLQEAFVTMHLDPYGKSILEKLSLERFDLPSNQDFSNVTKMLETIESMQ
ncbi:phosphate/phosphite/phosphonate ABC transporter substrate-binding protein [Sulfurospirillum barnesii]|uniref:Phosphate/phosphite/phosphonate ABC transporters, periplasmic binding protein n=1 Tax=Sulfurospirillum barnesii (strain ATCC 700032 / DSM 10660 / SES-3) TaxID=760154 RepID=I3Y0G0_SULBS|nr:phosphate/phosphite/phosphonate ABC transporter substrate-binding protein [Sulfurospirillum barnesii]AFL69684.1 phosphate/phosphite/phosphonate ABC transporters, periplasmic binding protein [Sulfurospirillum barnesii SES-3]